MTKSIISFLFPLLLMLSCVTAEKALNKGDHQEAISKALNKLKKKPNDRKSEEILREAYPSFIEEQQRIISDLENGYDPLKWEAIQERYEKMDEIYRDIRAIPVARRALPSARPYAREVRATEEKVINARYSLGMDYLAQGDRENAIKAVEHFEFILKKRAYLDTKERLEEARDLATIFIGIAPIPLSSFRYELNVAFFENQIGEYLQRENRNEYVQFVLPSDRRFPVDRLDYIIQMRFDDYVVGNTREKERIYNRRKENVATEKVLVGDSTIVRSIAAEAEVHCFTREIISSGLLNLQIINQHNGRREAQERFEGSHTYFSDWGYYEGDKRALNSEDNTCIARRNPTPIPPDQDLFTEFTIPIFDQATAYLKDYYRRY